MRFSTVCSGIEAASVAVKPLGWTPVFFSEIEKFPCAVLKHHYPAVPNYGDMTLYEKWPRQSIDVLIAGTPCQSFSVAGLRKGLADPRGNLALVFLEIVDKYRPTWICWENVPGVHSSWSDAAAHPASEESRNHLLAHGFDPGAFEEVDQSNDFDCFLSGLEKLGYGVATRIFDAQFFGLAQRRERVFVVGHIGGQWQRAAAVLFNRASVRWDYPPSRGAGKRVAGTLEGGASSGGHGRFASADAAAQNFLVARSLRGQSQSSHRADSETFVSHSLRADGFDASEDGTGRGTPLTVIPIQEIGKRQSGTPENGVGYGKPGDPMFTLQKSCQHGVAVPEVAWALQEHDSNGSDSSTKDGHLIPVVFDTTQITIKTNRSDPKPGDPCHTLAKGAHAPAIAFDCKASGQNGFGVGEIASTMRSMSENSGGHQAVAFASTGKGYWKEGGGTLRAREQESHEHLAVAQMAVRRLTPEECEALQGFPRGYTAIPYPVKVAADGPRYRALGNSFAVPCIRYIAERIELVEKLVPTK